MKKISLSLIAIAFAINFSYAQNTFPSTGYVGVGTSSPTSALDVNGTGRFSVTSSDPFNTVQVPLILTNGAGNGGAGAQINFSVGNAISYINSIIDGPASSTGSALSFGTPSTGTMGIERMRITSSGNVGIGTTNPLAKLSVQGPLAGRAVTWTDAVSNTGYLSIRNLGAAIGADNNLYFETAVGTSPVEMARFVGSTGYFGIGTTSPDQKLTVKGTIHSQEVIVDMSVLPDYVFKPTYHLPTLAEVKAYIDQNHHLPEMPSANQVAKEGLSLGEMNAKLLKKVEELTLYLMEKDKQDEEKNAKLQSQQEELKAQQKTNQYQQKEIDELKKQVSTLIKSKP